MKKFLLGLLVGALLFGSLGAFATSYIANPVDFKVLVNGKEFISDPPALEVEGRTYLPLRAMGEALGVPVTWNEELGQAEVGNSAPIAEEKQYSRNTPAPIDTVQFYNRTNSWLDSDNYSAAVRVMEVTRGAEAWKRIKDANMFNSEAEAGYEYIIAKVAFSLLSTKTDIAIAATSYDFDFYSGNNEEYKSVSVVLDKKLETNLYAGGNAEGYIVGKVRVDDQNPKVVYGLNYDGSGGIWFALQ